MGERLGIGTTRRRFALIHAARRRGQGSGACVRLALLAVVDQTEHQDSDRHHRDDDDHNEEDGEARAKAHREARPPLRLPAIRVDSARSSEPGNRRAGASAPTVRGYTVPQPRGICRRTGL